MLVFLIYLALAVVVWWHAWFSGPSVSLAAGSLDPSQEVWFLAWALHVLEHGGNPFFTRAAYAPEGVNLLANTSVLGLGALLAPITALFGPISSFNVAVTLAPAASAFTAFVAIRRYATWQPAAFVGALCYGFGPFLAVDLRYGHLNLTFLAIPPLILLVLDDLLVRHRHRPVVTGATLGALVVVQFFISTEMLLLTLIVASLGLLVLALGHLHKVPAAARRAAPGLLTGFLVAGAALAYPAWFALRGPRHVAGPVFANLNNLSSTVAAIVLPHGERAGVAFVSGGNGAFLGVPLLVLLVVAAAVWRRDAFVRFAISMTVITYIVSLGTALHLTQASTGLPLPGAVLGHLPVFDSIVASRFGAFVDLFAGLGLALVLDRLHAGDFGVLARYRVPRPFGTKSRSSQLRRSVGCAVITVVAVFPLVSLPRWPYPVVALEEPPIFHRVPLTVLTAGSVVRDYPPVLIDDTPLVWQAEGGFSYELSDGYAIVPGPQGLSTEEPPVDALAVVFAAVVLGTLKLPATQTTDLAVRRAVVADKITALVVTLGAKGSGAIVAVLSSAFGPPTRRVSGAEVWALGKPHRAPSGLPTS
ncbi:MAG: hypothetical protein ACLQRM_04310 [Acidimicrobiales bacterium]